MKQSFRLVHAQARQNALQAVRDAQDGMVVTIKPQTRSMAQNDRLWAMLGEVSAQVIWHGRKLTPEDWKIVFTASLKQMDIVPNLDSTGFVALGQSTSKMTVKEMCNLQTLIEAFGVQQGVKFSDFREEG